MSEYFGKGIAISTSFDLGSPKPLDSRTVVETYDELESMGSSLKYEGLSVYVKEEKTRYMWTGEEWILDEATSSKGSSIFVSNVSIEETEEVTTSDIVPEGIQVGSTVIDIDGNMYTVTDIDEDNTITFSDKICTIKGKDGQTGEKGDKGDPFTIAKTYTSVEEMEADYDNEEVPVGAFVCISCDVEEEDNAKLYVKGEEEFEFIMDLSGTMGIKGEDGKDGDSIRMGNTYDDSEEVTMFYRTVEEFSWEDDLTAPKASGLDNAKMDNTPIR